MLERKASNIAQLQGRLESFQVNAADYIAWMESNSETDGPGCALHARDLRAEHLKACYVGHTHTVTHLSLKKPCVQAQLRDEEELSNLISAKMHMRSDAAAFRQTREAL